MDPADLWNRFHPPARPSSTESSSTGDIRASFHDLAAYLNIRLPDGREKSLVMTKLEEACFFAVAAKERE